MIFIAVHAPYLSCYSFEGVIKIRPIVQLKCMLFVSLSAPYLTSNKLLTSDGKIC